MGDTLAAKRASYFIDSSKRPTVKKQNLTLIIGARCKDGVVLIADRKFTKDDGTSPNFETKLIGDLGGVIVGFSGNRSTFETFRTDVRNYAREREQDLKPEDVRRDNDHLIAKITEIKFCRERGV